MCGIAGYSLRSRSTIERTLAAQALLAAIAERGADAVGYAYRAPGRHATRRSSSSGRPPHSSSNECPCPTPRTSCSSTCATTRRAIRRSPPTTTRSGTGRCRDPQRDHPERRRAARPPLLRPGRAADDRRLGGDLRARSPLPERSRARSSTCAARWRRAWVDEREPERRLRRARQRPPALGRRGPRRRLLRLDEGCARGRRALLPASSCASASSARAPGWRSRTDEVAPARSASAPTLEYHETDPLPAVRAPQRARVLPRPPRGARRCPPSRARPLPSSRTVAPSSSSRSRTRYWNVAQAPRRASNSR